MSCQRSGRNSTGRWGVQQGISNVWRKKQKVDVFVYVWVDEGVGGWYCKSESEQAKKNYHLNGSACVSKSETYGNAERMKEKHGCS